MKHPQQMNEPLAEHVGGLTNQYKPYMRPSMRFYERIHKTDEMSVLHCSCTCYRGIDVRHDFANDRKAPPGSRKEGDGILRARKT